MDMPSSASRHRRPSLVPSRCLTPLLVLPGQAVPSRLSMVLDRDDQDVQRNEQRNRDGGCRVSGIQVAN